MKDIISQISPVEGLRVKWCDMIPNKVHDCALNHAIEVT